MIVYNEQAEAELCQAQLQFKLDPDSLGEDYSKNRLRDQEI